MTHRAYKFRIYPTPEQEILLRKTVGSCRFVYNWALAARRDSWVNGKKSMGFAKTCKGLTELKDSPEREWLSEVSSVCLQQSLRNLDAAFSNFFQKLARYPSFKKRRNGGSARYLDNAFRIKEGKLFLAKMDAPVDVRWSRELPSTPSSVTVKVNSSGKWFASFLCEEEIAKLPSSDKAVGIDAGIKTFATLSDGRKVRQPESVKRLRSVIAKAQRAASHKKKGSKNRARANLKVARLYERQVNIRNDFLHKLSTELVRENQAIAIEDLSVVAMMKNTLLARSIGEQGWRVFRQMLTYKCDWYGRELLVVDRFYPSSKTCSACGKQSALSLGDREWTCQCGAVHDRDVNAAKNILSAGQADKACGVDGRAVGNYPKVRRQPRSTKALGRPKESPSFS